MGYIEGTNRGQMTFWALEDLIEEESMVRVIDRYIETLDLAKLGFTRTKPAETGRPGYPAGMLAKLYVYGYENGIRSSRKLEKEAHRNVEVMWLTEGLTPDYKTIAEFRRLNIRPLQKLFREFVKLCRSWDLVGGEVIATDGSKIKASNNKKRNFSSKKLDDRLARLDEKISEYLDGFDEEDSLENEESVPAGLLELMKREELYLQYKEQLEKSGENEISETDPDARLMGNNRGGVEMAYNVQSAVDAKHHIILNYDVSMNPSDQGCLQTTAKMLMRDSFRRFTLLADKGFYNGVDLSKMKQYGITAIVPRQGFSNPKGQPAQFHTEQFQYNPETDTYTCPTGETLHLHSNKASERHRYFNKSACANCPHKSECISGKAEYRTVSRNKYSDICDHADQTYKDNQELYKLRQQIVEHPFGTIKHTMNGGHFLLRTRRKVRCEIALLFLGYNLKRACNALGFKEIMAKLDSLPSLFAHFIKIKILYLPKISLFPNFSTAF